MKNSSNNFAFNSFFFPVATSELMFGCGKLCFFLHGSYQRVLLRVRPDRYNEV